MGTPNADAGRVFVLRRQQRKIRVSTFESAGNKLRQPGLIEHKEGLEPLSLPDLCTDAVAARNGPETVGIVRDHAVHGLIGPDLGQVLPRPIQQFVDFGRGGGVDEQPSRKTRRIELGQALRVRAAIPRRLASVDANCHRRRPLGLQAANYFGKLTARGRGCMRALATRGEPPEAHGGVGTTGRASDWESVRLFIEVVRRGSIRSAAACRCRSARCVEELPTLNSSSIRNSSLATSMAFG